MSAIIQSLIAIDKKKHHRTFDFDLFISLHLI